MRFIRFNMVSEINSKAFFEERREAFRTAYTPYWTLFTEHFVKIPEILLHEYDASCMYVDMRIKSIVTKRYQQRYQRDLTKTISKTFPDRIRFRLSRRVQVGSYDTYKRFKFMTNSHWVIIFSCMSYDSELGEKYRESLAEFINYY